MWSIPLTSNKNKIPLYLSVLILWTSWNFAGMHPQDYTLAQVGPMGDILLKLILFRKISFCPFHWAITLVYNCKCSNLWSSLGGCLTLYINFSQPGFSAGWHNSFLVHLNLKRQGSCATTLLLHNNISMLKAQERPSRVRLRLGDRWSTDHQPLALQEGFIVQVHRKQFSIGFQFLSQKVISSVSVFTIHLQTTH
jgi:hypothetical protein